MKTFNTIYKRAKTGAVQSWFITVDGNSFFTTEGQVGGALSVSKPTYCTGKNRGKANETSDEQQALIEAEAKMRKKIEGKYTLNIDEIDTCCTYFDPQLAHKFIEYKEDVKWPALASTKIDGMRMVNVLDATTSRNGKNIVSCPHIGNALIPFFAKYAKGMVDGEIYANNEYFEDIMSIVKKTKPTPADLIESEAKAKLWVFDGIVEDKNEGFTTRFKKVRDAILETVAPEHLKYFVFVDNVVVNNEAELMAEHDKYVALGFEGVMLRYDNAPYKHGRTSLLLKYKLFFDDEFELLDIQEGTGNDAGIASRIIVRLKDGTTSEAGIKGTNKFTAKLLIERANYIGKKVTVRYQGFTKDGKLRFGVAINFDPFDR